MRKGWSRVVGPVASSLVLAAACSQASDSVTAGDRLTTDGTTSPAVSAPPRQVTTTLTTLVYETTSPTVASTVQAPPTSGGSGEGVVTSVSQPPTDETLPTVVPTSAPDIATTAPTAAPTSTAGPAPAGAVTISRVVCARHPEEGADWIVFYTNAPGANASAAYGQSPVPVSGDNAVVATFSPASDATSGRLDATGACDFATEVVLAGNADGTVTWVIGVRGRPNVVGPVASTNAAGQASVTLKLQV
jgi:hypothetical protein